MSWKRLTVDDLRTVLAEDEIQKLMNCSLDTELSGRIQQQIDNVADAFRGAFASKGYNMDVRKHYVPEEYVLPILNYTRWSCWTTFPMTQDFALSEPRKMLYEEAKELLKNPYIAVSKPDYSDDPKLSGDTTLNSNTDPAISMPWLKFPTMPFDTGFYKPYALYFDNMEEGI